METVGTFETSIPKRLHGDTSKKTLMFIKENVVSCNLWCPPKSDAVIHRPNDGDSRHLWNVYSNETTRRYIPEDFNLHTRRRENLNLTTMVDSFHATH
jgi:hypothetical protein